MFTINFQARPNPRDSKMAKIDMILYCSGFNRVSKVLPVTTQGLGRKKPKFQTSYYGVRGQE